MTSNCGIPGRMPTIARIRPTPNWNNTMAHTLPPLPFAPEALAPHLSKETFEYHYGKHHQAYVTGANAAAGLSGTFVVNGSPTKTEILEEQGGKSQVANMTMAGVVLIVTLFLTQFLTPMPKAVLGGIVFLIGYGLIDIKGLKHVKKLAPSEFWIAVITAAITLVVGYLASHGCKTRRQAGRQTHTCPSDSHTARRHDGIDIKRHRAVPYPQFQAAAQQGQRQQQR